MTPDLWRQIDRTFQAAIEIDPARRGEFLDETCAGNHVLRSEVDRLIYLDSIEWDLVDGTALESAAALLAYDGPQLEPGQQLGHYVIVEAIGRGGMGEVYQARDTVLDRGVALKLLHEDHTEDAARMERFRREARAVSALNYPNILTIYELGTIDGRQFIATELIDGETLRSLLTRGPLSVEAAIDVAIQTARALSAAHRAGIVHRDIKPENIMLRSDGYVKVLDFGLAKLVEIHEDELTPDIGGRLDISSMLMMGTPTYMSPEQVVGEKVDARSDVFSLGAVLYEMLTGKQPFIGGTREELATAILKEDPLPVGLGACRLDERLDLILARMLAKDRDARYQTADEVLAALTLLKNRSEPPEAESHTLVKSRAHRWVAPVIVTLLCAAVVGYVFFRFQGGTTAPGSAIASENEGTWVTKASISFPRSQAAAANINGVLYVAGGWDGRECLAFADFEAYDALKDLWVKRAPMNSARGAHAIAALDGMLYAVGGSVGCGQYISSVEAYDPLTDRWTAKAALPDVRSGHVAAASNGKLYAIGGQNSKGEIVNVNSEYDPASDTWIERAPMPTARTLAAVVVIKGAIYVIGGGGRQQLATVEVYDPTTDSWQQKAPMLTARQAFAAAELNGKIYVFGGAGNRLAVEMYDPAEDEWNAVGELPARRHSFGAASIDGWIYLVGGDDDVSYYSTVFAFSPSPSGESECRLLEAKRLSPMSIARAGTTAGAIAGRIFVAGGFDPRLGFQSANEAYDPGTDTWTTKSQMPGERETSGSNTAVLDDKLYVIGGNAKGYCTSANQAYDPATDAWTSLAPMPTPRCHSAAVAHEGRIFVLGGTNTSGSTRYSTVEIYDPSSDKWTTAAPMPSARHHLGAISLGGLIYAIGGWNPELMYESLPIVEAYDPRSGTWTTKAPLNFGRVAMAVGVLEGKIVVIGGESLEKTIPMPEIYDPVRDNWTRLSEMSGARALASAVAIDDVLYVFGGRLNIEDAEFLSSGVAYRLGGCSE